VENGPSAGVLTIAAAAWVIRTPVEHRFSNEPK